MLKAEIECGLVKDKFYFIFQNLGGHQCRNSERSLQHQGRERQYVHEIPGPI